MGVVAPVEKKIHVYGGKIEPIKDIEMLFTALLISL